MTVGEKLVTIADNTPIVCKAVESAKKEVNGNVVVANDISSIEHPIEVMLTNDSETPTDFSGVTVKQNGKNQVDITGWTSLGENCSNVVIEGDSVAATGKVGGGALLYSTGALHLRFWAGLPVACINQTITISIYATLLEQGVYDNQIAVYLANGTTTNGSRALVAMNLGERTKLVFTRTPTVDITGLVVRMNNNRVKFEMDTLQIEYGYEATDFEAYKEPITYTANADGTVEGVNSVAPSMVLICSDKETSINCRYFPIEADWKRNTLNEIARELEQTKEYLPK